MATYKITLESIKNLKKAIDYAYEYADNNVTDVNYGGRSFGDKEALVNSYFEKADNETKIICDILSAIDSKVDIGTVIDMAYDFEFAERILNTVYAA